MYQDPTGRPRFLSLTAFKFPFNAKLSILHRITGVALLISLIGYLALIHLILFHPIVTLESVSQHCIINCLSSIFWITLAFHWLSGLKHLLAEHFTQDNTYKIINSHFAGYAMIALWLIVSMAILFYFWGVS